MILNHCLSVYIPTNLHFSQYNLTAVWDNLLQAQKAFCITSGLQNAFLAFNSPPYRLELMDPDIVVLIVGTVVMLLHQDQSLVHVLEVYAEEQGGMSSWSAPRPMPVQGCSRSTAFPRGSSSPIRVCQCNRNQQIQWNWYRECSENGIKNTVKSESAMQWKWNQECSEI